MRALTLFCFMMVCSSVMNAQDYYYAKYAPFESSIPSPAEFLDYGIGDYHTRHDQIVAYLNELSETSDRANLIDYGKTHERRRLVMLQISTPEQLDNIEELRQEHLKLVDPSLNIDAQSFGDQPVFVNLAFNVHGNEPSGSESALLAAYVLTASNHPDIQRLRKNGITFLDPCINPDGRDRHTLWANSRRGVNVLIKDPMDAEHIEAWPRGRTNHFWFDLNRDWLLAVHPESQGKLEWYHNWYPNVVTDFHEMGTNSSYFFEPMKTNGSKDPIMPKANYTTLNDEFAKYYVKAMDELGSFYFTKEVFDGTYPGYGSSYPDLQGGLGILFEQASSRGHVQETPLGDLTFPFTIRNQFVNAIATVEAAVDNKELMHSYQREFFQSALSNARSSDIQSYVISETYDHSRMREFLELLLRHRIKVYTTDVEGQYMIPTEQPQYRMVQTMFETYSEYQDSVFYDASAWSLVNAYNIDHQASRSTSAAKRELTMNDLKVEAKKVSLSNYAYLISWDDYYAPAVLHQLLDKGVKVLVSQKEFTLPTTQGDSEFSYGTMVIPVQKQDLEKEELRAIIQESVKDYGIEVHSSETGFSLQGVDLGSRCNSPITQPKCVMLVDEGTSGYETGFVWHLLDQRVGMPVTKLRTSNFRRADLSSYNTLILTSGNYSSLDSSDITAIKEWASEGGIIIGLRGAVQWMINKKLVNESLKKNDEEGEEEKPLVREHYIHASEIDGKNSVGGAIFEISLDRTHPIAYGYRQDKIPVYRNSTIWLQPSNKKYSNIGLYSDDPHIDGFITKDNLENNLIGSASILATRIGSGGAVLFADDPNFRGTWYGTNKLFLNAIFFGDRIRTF